MDSELVVNQVNGVSAVRQAYLRELYKEATGLVAQFKSIRISWVPRELNVEADRLVDDALRAPAYGNVHTTTHQVSQQVDRATRPLQRRRCSFYA